MTRLSCLSRLILTCALVAGLCAGAEVWAAEGNGYVLKDGDTLKAKEVPLCREMLEILNLPENAHTVGLYNASNPIVFPARYKSFKPVEWKPISLPEVEKYFDRDQLRKGIEARKKSALNDFDWDGKGDFAFESTRVDLDDTGNLVTMLRYRLPTWKMWSCLLGNDAPPRYIQDFNDPMFYGMGRDCTVFTYGQRLYFTNSSSDLIIYKPQLLSAQNPDVLGQPRQSTALNLYNEVMCYIINPHAHEEFNEYYEKLKKE